MQAKLQSCNNIQLLTFVEVNIRIYRSKIYMCMIFIESEVDVNIMHLGTIDPYINRNESQ
jgi:hypothetical protein